MFIHSWHRTVDERTAHMRSAVKTAKMTVLRMNNSFLDGALALNIDQHALVPKVNEWSRLSTLGLPEPDNVQQSESAISHAVSQWLLSADSETRVFAVRKEGHAISVLFGNGQKALETAAKANGLDLGLQAAPAFLCPTYCGLMLGGCRFIRLADTVAAADNLTNCCVAVVITPASGQETADMLRRGRDLIARLEPYRSVRRVYGDQTRREEEIPVPEVVQALNVLEQECTFLQQNMPGFVRASLVFGAASQHEFNRLASLLRSCAVNEEQTAEPVRCLQLRGTQDTIAIPGILLPGTDGPISVFMQSHWTISTAVAACLPPVRSYEGYYLAALKDMAFRPVSPSHDKNAIVLGRQIITGQPSVIPYRSIASHICITGIPGSGKTTSVKRILNVCSDQEMEFLVLESAKKEYASLAGSVPTLRILGSGIEAMPLCVNPLQPEDGTPVEIHCQALVQAIVSSMPAESPIPEAMEGLFQMLYTDAGWPFGTVAYEDPDRPWPVLRDALSRINDYVDSSAEYGRENRLNLKAALHLRLATLSEGALGQLFSLSRGLKMKDLLAAPTVIEMADFGEQSAAFITNHLFFRLQTYLLRQDPSPTLRRIVVIEEAHRLFHRTNLEGTAQARSVAALEQALSELRASGTGIILAEQSPSLLPDSVLANSAVKIAHATASADDRDTLARAMGLNPQQSQALRALRPGQCLVSISGTGIDAVQYTKTDIYPVERDITAACTICFHRSRCLRREAASLAGALGSEKVSFHCAHIAAAPYSMEAVGQNVSAALSEVRLPIDAPVAICFVGELLQRGGIPFSISRVITMNFYKYRRKERQNGA